MDIAPLVAGVVGLLVGSLLNRLIVREPGYVITDPGDLPEGADPALLDELEPTPEPRPVPILALVRPRKAWRRWFPVTELVTGGLYALTVHRIDGWSAILAIGFLVTALVVLGGVDLRVPLEQQLQHGRIPLPRRKVQWPIAVQVGRVD